MNIEGLFVDWCYFLSKKETKLWIYPIASCDGIYPKLRFLMSTIGIPQTNEQKLFASMQEGVRKAVERVFGVLFKKYQILYRPCRLWSVADMTNVVKA